MSVSCCAVAHRLTLAAPRQVAWEEFDRPGPDQLGPNDVLIRSVLSAIKHGTEGAYHSGECVFHDSELDAETRLFRERARPLFPMPLGNMTAGTVVARGSAVSHVAPGESVYGWLPVADHHVCSADRVWPLGALTPARALFIDPTIFALGALRDAGTNVAGKRVTVFGLGAIGLLTVALARRWGATVFAASSFPLRREAARRLGAEVVFTPAATPDVAAAIKRATGGGAEVVFECSGRYPQLNQALRAARKHGSVVTLGFYSGEARGVHLGREAFHNRLAILFSLPAMRFGNQTRDGRSYGELRQEAVALLASGELNVDGLLRPVLPFAEAADAFLILEQQPEQTIKIGIAYDPEE